MTINIGMRAGRGDDGYTASIDIVKKGSVPSKLAVVYVPEPKEEATEPPFEADKVVEQPVVTEAPKPVQLVPEPTEEPKEVKEVVVTPKRSIFANLTI